MELHKIGVKFFTRNGTDIALTEFIPVFHDWIQNKRCEGVLIDVADYSHVHAGPGIVLVAHEGNFALDETGQERGLVYYSKQAMAGNLTERLLEVMRTTLKACRLLEDEASLNGGMTFQGNCFEMFSNDRLVAPDTDETFAKIQPVLSEVLERLYPNTDCKIERKTDTGERFTLRVTTPTQTGAAELLERIS